jgi:hypothetical protein
MALLTKVGVASLAAVDLAKGADLSEVVRKAAGQVKAAGRADKAVRVVKAKTAIKVKKYTMGSLHL